MKKSLQITALVFAALLFLIYLIAGPMSDTVKNKIDKIITSIHDKNTPVETPEDDDTTEVEESDEQYHGPYQVARVVDGDTLIVDIDGKITRVRLIGVNTPESVSPNENENCEEGKTASNYTKNLLEKKNVYLEFDVDKYDDYDRLLAYVYTEDMIMVNKLLIKEGYAQSLTVEPNIKYEKDFYQLQKNAKENKAGFWKENAGEIVWSPDLIEVHNEW